jgi:mannitol-1-phosphate 5-dehydrogenase
LEYRNRKICFGILQTNNVITVVSIMKGIIFGAGSVGRGFIGELFFDANMEICFIDINETIINGINNKNNYPHITVYNDQQTVKWIDNCRAISSLNEEDVIAEIETADIIATSLGANVLSVIAPALAKGLINRLKAKNKGINILLCENLPNVDQYMFNLLIKEIAEEDQSLFSKKIGLLSTSIGRMIPISSVETQEIHPAAIKVEPYKFLPYDGSAIKEDFPSIPNLIWDESVDFSYYADRKLYIHNMGHCLTAYLSEYFDYEYIWQGILNPVIRYFVRSAMIESAVGLATKYNKPVDKLIAHIDNLIMRFGNKALLDTCERVGRDPERKLKADDRFLGALNMCLEQDTSANHLSLGVALGLIKLTENTNSKLEKIHDYLKSEYPKILTEAYKTQFNILKDQLAEIILGFDYQQQIDLIDIYSAQNII